MWDTCLIRRYQGQRRRNGVPEDAGLVGHIHLHEVIDFLRTFLGFNAGKCLCHANSMILKFYNQTLWNIFHASVFYVLFSSSDMQWGRKALLKTNHF